MKNTSYSTVLYNDLRKKMFEDVKKSLWMTEEEKIEEKMRDETWKQCLFVALLGETENGKWSWATPALRTAALEYCGQAMRRRNNIVLKMLDQRT